jgi:hypothetical protein
MNDQDQYLIRHKETNRCVTLYSAECVATFLDLRRLSEWEVWRRCELSSNDAKEIREELERVEVVLKQRELLT